MRVQRILVLIALFVAALAASAQGYPTKPIRFVVGFPPGGGNDIVARMVGAKMQEAWGQPVVIDNKPGANSIIAAEYVAKSTPDGYTLLVNATGGMSVNPVLYSKLPYDPLRDFVSISMIGTFAPADTPGEIAAQLSTEMARIVRLPDVREKLAALGIQPVGNTSEQFAGMIRNEIARFGPVVKAGNIKAE